MKSNRIPKIINKTIRIGTITTTLKLIAAFLALIEELIFSSSTDFKNLEINFQRFYQVNAQ